MLTCQELTELVTDWLEGRLPFRTRVSVQIHLGMCWRCRAYLRQIKMTIRTLGKLPDEPMPQDIREELLARFRNMHPSGSKNRRSVVPSSPTSRLEGKRGGRLGWGMAALMVAAAAVLALVTGGDEGPILRHWGPCLAGEIAAASILVIVGSAVASARQRRLSSGASAALASAGGLACYALLAHLCPMAKATSHVLVVHVGAILVAALLGSLVPRLQDLASE
ncbi:MAG: zf-HC2 domain-containing protein [Planctomycetes bacterium]|nr:zf-HC2 domain-containing protein [Planctomycetota bacterium]